MKCKIRGVRHMAYCLLFCVNIYFRIWAYNGNTRNCPSFGVKQYPTLPKINISYIVLLLVIILVSSAVPRCQNTLHCTVLTIQVADVRSNWRKLLLTVSPLWFPRNLNHYASTFYVSMLVFCMSVC